MKCRSEWQTPAAAVRMSTSRRFSGTFSTSSMVKRLMGCVEDGGLHGPSLAFYGGR